MCFLFGVIFLLFLFSLCVTIADINARKPDIENLVGAVDDIVFDILSQIKNEPHSSEEKVKILEGIAQSRGSAQWVHFLQDLSEPILEALSERSKLFPTNQYEEFLSKLNHMLNDIDFVSNLRSKLLLLLTDQSLAHSPFIGMILFRLCFKMCEDIQVLILKEMSNKQPVQCEIPETSCNTKEFKLFSGKISSVIRSYFCKAIRFPSEVWKVRCDCSRHRFVVCEVEPVKVDDLMNKRMWVSGDIRPSDEMLDFCWGVESIIKANLKEVSSDELMKSLIFTSSASVNKWQSLTHGYLSEVDSITFMRDFVLILMKLSYVLESSQLKEAEAEKRRLQQFGIREDLKRN